ncbi:uncharacterized protein METZ01_LOCUS161814, partial [marine metagenome]
RQSNYTIIWFNLTFLLIKATTAIDVYNMASNIF